jgi:hypothetical protein
VIYGSGAVNMAKVLRYRARYSFYTSYLHEKSGTKSFPNVEIVVLAGEVCAGSLQVKPAYEIQEISHLHLLFPVSRKKCVSTKQIFKWL